MVVLASHGGAGRHRMGVRVGDSVPDSEWETVTYRDAAHLRNTTYVRSNEVVLDNREMWYIFI